MKIIFRRLKSGKDQYERILPLSSILGIKDKLAVSVSANMGKSYAHLYLERYGRNWEDFSNGLFNAQYDSNKTRKVTFYQCYYDLPIIIVPPTFDSFKPKKILRYAEEILRLAVDYRITKLHFTHFATNTSDLKTQEVREILKVFLNPGNATDLQVCFDINENNSEGFKKLYLECLNAYSLSDAFDIHPANKFQWEGFLNLAKSQKVDLQSPGIYTVMFRGQDDEVSSYGNDKRRVANGIPLKRGFIKIGKAKNLMERYKNYESSFGIKNIVFCPLFNSSEIDGHENRLKQLFDIYRIRNPKTNRRLEWMRFPNRLRFFSDINMYLHKYATGV